MINLPLRKGGVLSSTSIFYSHINLKHYFFYIIDFDLNYGSLYQDLVILVPIYVTNNVVNLNLTISISWFLYLGISWLQNMINRGFPPKLNSNRETHVLYQIRVWEWFTTYKSFTVFMIFFGYKNTSKCVKLEIWIILQWSIGPTLGYTHVLWINRSQVIHDFDFCLSTTVH